MNKASSNYAIKWKSTITGKEGQGNFIFDEHEAKNEVNRLNQKFPEIEHSTISKGG